MRVPMPYILVVTSINKGQNGEVVVFKRLSKPVFYFLHVLILIFFRHESGIWTFVQPNHFHPVIIFPFVDKILKEGPIPDDERSAVDLTFSSLPCVVDFHYLKLQLGYDCSGNS